jgi:hypothetical protein
MRFSEPSRTVLVEAIAPPPVAAEPDPVRSGASPAAEPVAAAPRPGSEPEAAPRA